MLKYSGNSSELINADLIGLVRDSSKLNIKSKSMVSKVLMCSIELLDNALRYGIDTKITLAISHIEDNNIIEIVVSNNSKLVEIKKLQETITKYSQLSNSELDLLYFKVLHSGAFSERGGAGLGLLQIFRRGILSLEIDVKEISTEIGVCNIKLIFNSEKKNGEANN
jgi:hypothetical protein